MAMVTFTPSVWANWAEMIKVHLYRGIWMETWKCGLETHLASCRQRGSWILTNSSGLTTSNISSISPRNITCGRGGGERTGCVELNTHHTECYYWCTCRYKCIVCIHTWFLNHEEVPCYRGVGDSCQYRGVFIPRLGWVCVHRGFQYYCQPHKATLIQWVS